MTILQPCSWIVDASALFRLPSPNHSSKGSHSKPEGNRRRGFFIKDRMGQGEP